MTIVCYAISDQVSPGKVLHVEAQSYTHELYIFHSEEEYQQLVLATGRALTPIADAPIKIPPLTMPMEFRVDPDTERRIEMRARFGYRVIQ
jgi:hypothetical protein